MTLGAAGGTPESGSGTTGGDGISSSSVIDARKELTIVGTTMFMQSNKASTSMSSSVKKYVDREGTAWRFVSEEYKNTYWEEFKKLFRWDPAISEELVYTIWCKRAAIRYQDWVGDIKAERRSKGRPAFITEDIWAHWCAYWETEALKRSL